MGLFFQDFKAKEFFKIPNLGKESFYYDKPSTHFEKTSGKKSWKEKKEQYCL